MKQRKKSITGFLIGTFLIAMIIAVTSSFFAFSQITKSAFKEVKEINIDDTNTTQVEIENKIGRIFDTAGHRLMYTVLSSFFVGSIMMLAASKRLVKPIKNLTKATKEIADGNFDVELKSKVNDEIGELTENFNKMANTLKNVEYLQKDFMRNVSHEFKTPVASIQGFANLLKDETISEQEKNEYLDIIAEESKRLSNLSTNVLKLSKIENKDFKLNIEEFELDEQIRKSILILEQQWNKKKINFDLKLKPVKIKADKELLQQVWMNIIGNAIKFSNDNGKIVVSLKQTEDRKVIVEIKDNGIGIPQEKQERIFERFYQADKSHSSKGNGLGLTICKKIISLHKGTISFKSKEGKGTSFKIEI